MSVAEKVKADASRRGFFQRTAAQLIELLPGTKVDIVSESYLQVSYGDWRWTMMAQGILGGERAYWCRYIQATNGRWQPMPAFPAQRLAYDRQAKQWRVWDRHLGYWGNSVATREQYIDWMDLVAHLLLALGNPAEARRQEEASDRTLREANALLDSNDAFLAHMADIRARVTRSLAESEKWLNPPGGDGSASA
ncbi:MAG: hypothetical protein ACRDHX_03535 [Chloroflexota bacterium]